MWLIVGILLVDAAAIGSYYLVGMETRSAGVRLGFTIAWVVATLAVVVPRLQRIRGHRTRLRRTTERR